MFFKNHQDLNEALKKKGEIGGRAVKIEEHIQEENETSYVQEPDLPKWLVKTEDEIVSAILEASFATFLLHSRPAGYLSVICLMPALNKTLKSYFLFMVSPY